MVLLALIGICAAVAAAVLADVASGTSVLAAVIVLGAAGWLAALVGDAARTSRVAVLVPLLRRTAPRALAALLTAALLRTPRAAATRAPRPRAQPDRPGWSGPPAHRHRKTGKDNSRA